LAEKRFFRQNSRFLIHLRRACFSYQMILPFRRIAGFCAIRRIFHDFAKISGIRAADESAWHATDEIFPGAITQPWPGAYTIRARTGIRGGEVSPDIIGL